MTLILRRTEVVGLLDLERAVEAIRAALQDQRDGATRSLPPSMLAFDGGAMRMTTGALTIRGRMGVRVGIGGRTGLFDPPVASLYDMKSGELLAIMSYPFGPMRVSATIAIAIQRLAPPDATSVGLIGTGRNALSLLKAARHARDVNRIRVYSRDAERRESFARAASHELGADVETSDCVESAVEDAEIVLTATSSPVPVLRRESLMTTSVFVGSMGMPSELDSDVYLAADLIVVGSKDNELGWFGHGLTRHELVDLAREERLDWDDVQELHELLAEDVSGSSSSLRLVVFKESQGGVGDIALAAAVYENAIDQGIGFDIDLAEDDE